MKRIILAVAMVALAGPAMAQQMFIPGGHPNGPGPRTPEQVQEDDRFMREFHRQQAASVECKRMNIGCPEVETQPAPVRIKSTAEIQSEADAAWAYALNLHPSWGKESRLEADLAKPCTAAASFGCRTGGR